MDNKNEKTFADLFSNSTSENNSEDINDNIKKEVNDEIKEDATPLTFDSLFDQVSKDILENESKNESKNEENEIGLNSLFEKSNQDNSLELKNENNDFFSMEGIVKKDNIEKDNNVSFSEINFSASVEKEEIDKINDEETVNNNIEFNNDVDNTVSDVINIFPIKEESKNETSFVNNDDLVNNKINIDNKLNNPFLESKSLNSVEKIATESNNLSSPFFSDSEKKEEVFDSESNKVKNDIQNNNPLFETDNNMLNSNDNVKEDLNNSLFENNSSNIEKNAENDDDIDEKKDLDNLFFKDDKISEDNISDSVSDKIETSNDNFSNVESNLDVNPLFGQNSLVSDNSESILEPETTDVVSKEENKNFGDKPNNKKEVNEVSDKSISPFFEEETVAEENPLFLDKINLIENVEITKKISKIDTNNIKHFDVSIVKKKEPLLKFIIGVASYALFILLLLIGVTLLVYVLDIKIRASKGDYSAPTFNAYVVLTGSMLPEIQVYDVVVTKKIDASKLEEGDVITFASADTRFLNTIITHRIIKKNYDSKTKTYNFQTRGDNNNVADSALVPQNNIYGKVILKIPKLGYLQEFLASRGGWIIVILIPCLTVISYDVVKLLKGLKKNKDKNIKVQK